jgi:polyhydroxyalkanoate synthesis repressor PhaR
VRLDIHDALRYVPRVTRKAAPPAARLIRRYDNRKLYDVRDRRYVVLDDLARMVGAGEEVRVEDRRTGEDHTAVVMAQVILEGVKQRTARIPGQVLARLVRLGFAPDGRRHWPDPAQAATQARREAERIVAGLLARGRLTLDEGLALRQEIAGAVQRLVADAQHGLESRVHRLLDGAGDVRPSLAALRDRLFSLETPRGDRAPRARRPSRKSRSTRKEKAR